MTAEIFCTRCGATRFLHTRSPGEMVSDYYPESVTVGPGFLTSPFLCLEFEELPAPIMADWMQSYQVPSTQAVGT